MSDPISDTQETAVPFDSSSPPSYQGDNTAAMSIDGPVTTGAATTSTSMPVHHLPTVQAYDAWATVYDTDGNMLQGIDDMELESMLPTFLASVVEWCRQRSKRVVRIVDFGCGTGRNTAKILGWDGWPAELRVEVVGIDASTGMLDVAMKKLSGLVTSKRTFELHRHDFLHPGDPELPPVPFSRYQVGYFDALVSTLVLEHFPLKPYFMSLASLVAPSAMALVTNMHPDMGSRSQAGFVSTDVDGAAVKVRGTSWVHGVEATAATAVETGFEVTELRERAVEDGSMVDKLGLRSKKWIGINVWYGMVLQNRTQAQHSNGITA